MNTKTDITKKVLEILNPTYTEKDLKMVLSSWWINKRNKTTGGLRLTDSGCEYFKKAEIKAYKIKIESPVRLTNQSIIWLDRSIDCPWHVGHKEIILFGERAAIQLVLFGGDIAKFSIAGITSEKMS